MREVKDTPWGILLVSSGTRSLAGQRQTQNFAAGLKRRMGRKVPVVIVYLEAQEPSFRSVLPIIDESGVHDWLCVPLYLFTTGYTVFDSPILATKLLLLRRPHLNLRWMPGWGTERQLISLAAGYVYRLLLDFDETATSVVLVGGASSCPKTFHKYRQVSRRLSKWIGTPVNPSILSGVGTSVYELLNENTADSNSMLFIPYVAFDGLLLENFRQQIMRLKTPKVKQMTIAQLTVAQPLFTQTNFNCFVYGKIASRFYDVSHKDTHCMEEVTDTTVENQSAEVPMWSV